MASGNGFDAGVIEGDLSAPTKAAGGLNSRVSWQYGAKWGAFLAAAYLVLVVAPLGVFVLMRGESDAGTVAEAGADFGVVGFTIVALQFVVTARFRWIERPFGLDLLVAFHKRMAIL